MYFLLGIVVYVLYIIDLFNFFGKVINSVDLYKRILEFREISDI